MRRSIALALILLLPAVLVCAQNSRGRGFATPGTADSDGGLEGTGAAPAPAPAAGTHASMVQLADDATHCGMCGFSRNHWIASRKKMLSVFDANNSYFANSLRLYDPVTNTWETLWPAGNNGGIQKRDNHASFYVPALDEFWIWSGSYLEGYGAWLGNPSARAYRSGRFSFRTNRWIAVDYTDSGAFDGVVKNMPSRLLALDPAMAWSADLDMGLMFGGLLEGNASDDMWIFEPNPAGPQRYKATRYEGPRPPAIGESQNSMVAVGRDFYLVRGSSFWKFDGVQRVWSKLPSPPTPGLSADPVTYDSRRRLIVAWRRNKLSAYSIEDGLWRDVTPQGLPCVSNQMAVYAPTADIHIYEGGNDCTTGNPALRVLGIKLGDTPTRPSVSTAPRTRQSLLAASVEEAASGATTVMASRVERSNITVTLQDGLDQYNGTRDTYLSPETRDNYGSRTTLYSHGGHPSLIRFAIFKAEHGPVPDGVTVVSATLSLYTSDAAADFVTALRVLKDWRELEATRDRANATTFWYEPLAGGASDAYPPESKPGYVAGPGWLNLDVTGSVQRFAIGERNYGWKLLASDYQNAYFFKSRESAAPSLRPKLTITYSPAPYREPANTPALTLTASASTIPFNTSVTLSWSGKNVSSCTATRDWYGAKATSGSEVRGPLTIAKEYALTCSGRGGSITRAISVGVTDVPPLPSDLDKPLPLDESGRIMIPARQWIARPLPSSREGPCPRRSAGCRQLAMTHHPENGRIYIGLGNSDGPPGLGNLTVHSYSIARGDWREESPTCRPAGEVQTSYAVGPGFPYDGRRRVFWMLPGFLFGYNPATSPCSPPASYALQVGFHPMSFDPAAQRWGVPGLARLVTGSDNPEFYHYDAATDSIIGFGIDVVHSFHFETNRWSTHRLVNENGRSPGISIDAKYQYSAFDPEARVIYIIAPGPDKLVRYNIDTRTVTVLGDLPVKPEPAGGAARVTILIWDPINRVLLWPFLPNLAGTASTGWPTLYIYHPDRNTWEQDAMYQPNGLAVRGVQAVFDPLQNALMLIGGLPTCSTSERGAPCMAPNAATIHGVSSEITHFFLYRYSDGTYTPPPPPARRGLDLKLTSYPMTVYTGYDTSAMLQWYATDATACAASGGWSGPKPIVGSEFTPPLKSDKTYALTCTGTLGSSVTKTVTVHVGSVVPSTKFRIGQRVQTTTSTPVHYTTSLHWNSASEGRLDPGQPGTVIGGPFYDDSRWMWRIRYESGLTGWSPESSLRQAR